MKRRSGPSAGAAARNFVGDIARVVLVAGIGSPAAREHGPILIPAAPEHHAGRFRLDRQFVAVDRPVVGNGIGAMLE